MPEGDPKVSSISMKWAPHEKRPPSNWAQIIQAAVSICVLIIAVITYIFTVVPVQRIVALEERRLTLEKKLAEIQSTYGFMIVASREVAIDKFIYNIAQDGKTLAKPFGRLGGEESEISWADAPGNATVVYDKIDLSGVDLDKARPTKRSAWTGIDIIRENLDVVMGFSVLTLSERKALVKEIEKFVQEYRDPQTFTEALNVKVKIEVISRRADVIEEATRHFQAHERFAAAILELRKVLRQYAERFSSTPQ